MMAAGFTKSLSLFKMVTLLLTKISVQKLNNTVNLTTIEMSKHHCKNIVTETDLQCAIINCCCCKQNAIAMHLVGLQC